MYVSDGGTIRVAFCVAAVFIVMVHVCRSVYRNLVSRQAAFPPCMIILVFLVLYNVLNVHYYPRCMLSICPNSSNLNLK